MKRTVFIDRDGVICEEINHLHKLEQIKLLDGAVKGIKLLNEKEYLTVVISNQAVVARELCTEEEVRKMNDYMNSLLEQWGARIDVFYFCPHHPTVGNNPNYTRICDCRKPKPGMIFLAAKELEIGDLGGTFYIGDKTSDIAAGKSAGCKTILVRTGYGGNAAEKEIDFAEPDFIADNLECAVKDIILKH